MDDPRTDLEQIPEAPWRRLPPRPMTQLRDGLETVLNALTHPTTPDPIEEQP